MAQNISQEPQLIYVNLSSDDAEPFIAFLKRHGCKLLQGEYHQFKVTLPAETRMEPYHPFYEGEGANYSKITFPDGVSFIEWHYSDTTAFGFLYGNPFE